MQDIQNNADLFSTINRIRESVALRGDSDTAAQLKRALSISTVPGEILGEVRLRLTALAKNGGVDTFVAQDIARVLRYIDRLL